MTEIQGIRMYSKSEILDLLKITKPTLRAYIKRKLLYAVKIGKQTWIPEPSLKQFLCPDVEKQCR